MGEELIKPAAIDMVRQMCGKEQAAKLASVPLSNDTVQRRIMDMSLDVKEQVIKKIKDSGDFSLQLDETTDVAKCAQLLTYVRISGPDDLEEHFLFCKPLEMTTKGIDIFNLVDSFFMDHGIEWANCFSICCDGAPSMLVSPKGFVTEVKKKNPAIIIVHCLLHRENLASQKLSGELSEVLKDVVSIVNFIKARALNTRLFNELCEEMGSEFKNLLFDSEVRWLSKGKVIERVLKLQVQVETFLHEKNLTLSLNFQNIQWKACLGYLGDIMAELNQLNLSMQGKQKILIDTVDKISAFKDKLCLWSARVEKNKFASFPNLNLILEDANDDAVQEKMKQIVLTHLKNLCVQFDKYIPEKRKDFEWVKNPFTFAIDPDDDRLQFSENMIELQNDTGFEQMFQTTSLTEFWTNVKKEKPLLWHEAKYVLLPFPTSCMCEAGFSQLTVLKTSIRNRLNVQHPLRLALSNIEPCLEKLTRVSK